MNTVENEIKWNDSVKTPVNQKQPSVGIAKTGWYSPSDGKAYYTITITATGDNTNVVVTDTPGSAFQYVSGSIKDTGYVDDSYQFPYTVEENDNGGFIVTIPAMEDGQVITLQYESEVDLQNITGSGKETENTATATSNQDDETHTADIDVGPIKTSSIGKSVVLNDDKTVATWTIVLSGDISGHEISDVLGDALTFSGDGLNITVVDSDGTEYLQEGTNGLISWDELEHTDTTWSYTLGE